MKTPSNKIKNYQLDDLRSALLILGNFEAQQSQQQPGQPPSTKPFIFQNTGKVRWNLARTYNQVDRAFKDLELTRASLQKEFIAQQMKEAPGQTQLRGKFLNDYSIAFNEVLEQDADVKIFKVNASDLDVGNNAVPYTALGALLGVVITDDDNGNADDSK